MKVRINMIMTPSTKNENRDGMKNENKKKKDNLKTNKSE